MATQISADNIQSGFVIIYGHIVWILKYFFMWRPTIMLIGSLVMLMEIYRSLEKNKNWNVISHPRMGVGTQGGKPCINNKINIHAGK